VHALNPLLSAFIPEPKSEVEVHAIEAPSEAHAGTCHHHPQGCPADCFCPKTGFVGEEVSASPVEPGEGAVRVTSGATSHLVETSWVECSETRAAAAPAFAVYLPEPAREIAVFETSETFVISQPACARDRLRAPPAKIPIV
jgi:hypothetical protein